jgi:hypothetical protein
MRQSPKSESEIAMGIRDRSIPSHNDRLIVTREGVTRAITATLFAIKILEDYEVETRDGETIGDFLVGLNLLRKSLGMPVEEIEREEEAKSKAIFLTHGYVVEPKPLSNGGSEHGKVVEW